MKVKARIISVLMIMMMVISGMSFSSYAATATKGTVYVSVTQDYANAQKMLTLINKQRTKRGLKKVKLDKSLTTAAVKRAAEVSIVIPLTSPHRRPDGRYARTVHKLATRENCAEGTYESAASVVRTWMNSKPHKATLLLKSARSVGIAYVHNQSNEHVGYFVLIVSNSKAKKVEKSKKQVNSTQKVVALAKYLKSKYFYPEVMWNRTKIGVGDTASIRAYYSGPKTLDFTSTAIKPTSFTWTSSDKSVATVGSDGTVTAVSPGTVTIKAKLKKGPSVSFSQKITVNTSEFYFDKLTDYLLSDNCWHVEGDGFGYEEGNIHINGYFGGSAMDDSIIDPETGEEIEVYDYEGEYVLAQESRAGEEAAFMCRNAHIVGEDAEYQHRTYMIVSKTDGKIDDTITFIHDYVDKDDNCFYKLKATADRSSVDTENLQWEVVQNDSGEAIDYGLISDQLSALYISDAFNYLYGKTGIRFRNLGIHFV